MRLSRHLQLLIRYFSPVIEYYTKLRHIEKSEKDGNCINHIPVASPEASAHSSLDDTIFDIGDAGDLGFLLVRHKLNHPRRIKGNNR